MEFICESCRTRLRIAENDLPAGKPFGITCPRCGTRQRVTSGTAAEEDPGLDRTPHETAPSPDDLVEKEKDSRFFDQSTNLELALVLPAEKDEGAALAKRLREIGYRSSIAATHASAIGKLRLYPFELVFLADGFAGAPAGGSPVLKHLNSLSMSVRRHIFVVVLSDTLTTMDPLGAFALSSDLVVNRADLRQLASILRHALSDKKRFYKAFLDTLGTLGKV